jgi:outer membrane protein TolC
VEEYLELARMENPDLKRIRAAVAAEEAKYLAEKSKFYPSILAVGGVRYAVAPGRTSQESPFAYDPFNYNSAGGALGVKWDLNFFQTDAEVNKQRVGFLKMKSKLRQGLDGIEFQVKDKFYRVIEQKANLEAGFESRKAGRALLFLSLTNFKFGIGTGKDLFDALSVYARTTGKYAEAVYHYNTSVLELKNVVGMSLSSMNQ